jgi:DNA-binding MarR family transcriptional regulator
MAPKSRYPYVMSGVLEAWDWFDSGLQNLVKAAGFRTLNKSQSMMMLYISAGVQRPIEVARRMRLSRQAIRHIANQLIDMDVLVATDDPSDGRSMILSFSQRSDAIRNFAQMAIHDLENTLQERLGARNAQTLRDLLELDWGPPVKSVKDLSPRSRTGMYMKKNPARGPKRSLHK